MANGCAVCGFEDGYCEFCPVEDTRPDPAQEQEQEGKIRRWWRGAE